MPSWLLFDKKGGIFWGVPLSQDVGVLKLSIKPIGGKSNQEDITIKIIEPTEEASGAEKCQQNEDNTVLTLLLDKNIKAIKPKQRIIAINNIAKFFGLPYVSSAFLITFFLNYKRNYCLVRPYFQFIKIMHTLYFYIA